MSEGTGAAGKAEASAGAHAGHLEPADDRRQGDRRRSDRRLPRGRRRNDSVFGVSGDDAGASVFDAGWFSAGDAMASQPASKRGAARGDPVQDSALTRIFRTYLAARAAVGMGLVVVQGVASLIGSRSTELLALVSLAYAVQSITLWLLPRFSPFAQPQTIEARRRRQWMVTIGVDLLAFTCLHVLESGVAFNYGALLVLPVLMAGVFSPRLLALATASGVALLLLGVAWRNAPPSELPGLMLQTGLMGLGLFIITLMAGELAARLAREERSARGSLELARQQAQLNRLVIEEMVDGVLVVDQQLRVRAANPAARSLLVSEGLCAPAPFLLGERAAWKGLLGAVEQAMRSGQWPEAGRDVELDFGEGHLRTLRMRVRFMRQPGLRSERSGVAGDGAAESFSVLLLEDLRTLQARIRQEKLAAMGRVSAGIAHEIRNPLAAISQANALLMEDDLAPEQLHLTRMVADNVARLKRLVEDVMEVAPGMPAAERVIDLRASLQEMIADWASTATLPAGRADRLQLQLGSAPLAVLFDPEHLRRVVVNLLDNANRHASADPDAVALRIRGVNEQTAELSVFSDGVPIAPEVERFLFEPFFSTRSRGTGLGLYICRELCERYGATIDYQRRSGAETLRNEFVVRLQRRPLHSLAGTLA